MNKIISKQVEAANYTVAGKKVERQQISQHMAELEQRLIKERMARKGERALVF